MPTPATPAIPMLDAASLNALADMPALRDLYNALVSTTTIA